MNDNLTQVDIYGQQYTLRGEGDPQYIKSLAKYIDTKMKEVSEGTPTVDSLRVAVLAAINIADEYFQLKLEWEKIQDTISRKTENIAEMIDQEVRD